MAEKSMSKRRNTQDSYLLTTGLKYFRIPSEVGTKNFERSAKMIAWCDRSKWQFSPSGFFFLLSARAAAKAHCCCPKETSSNEVSAAQNHPQMSTLVSSEQSWECATWTEFKVWRQVYSGRAWLGCGLNQALQPSLSSSCTQSPGKEMLFHDALHQLLLTWRAVVLSLILSLTPGLPAAWWISIHSWVGCGGSEVERQEWQQKQERRSTVSGPEPRLFT